MSLKNIYISVSLIVLSAVITFIYFFSINSHVCIVEFSSTDAVANKVSQLEQKGKLKEWFRNSYGEVDSIVFRKALSVYDLHSIHIQKKNKCKYVDDYMSTLEIKINNQLNNERLFGLDYESYKADFCNLYLKNKDFIEEKFFKKYQSDFSSVHDFYARYKTANEIREVCLSKQLNIDSRPLKVIKIEEKVGAYQRIGFYGIASFFIVILFFLIGLVIVYKFIFFNLRNVK